MATKEEILGQVDLAVQEVVVPEWGGMVVRLRALSGAARDAYELDTYLERQAAARDSRPTRNVRARLLVYCIVDETGAPLFTPKEIDKLGEKSGKALDRLWDAASLLNGYSQADKQKLELDAAKKD